jgi:16S rRNA (cytidine1402-2'-O)-methyltransferase
MSRYEPSIYIVSVPIGNWADITRRAIEILDCVDFIICEHEREYDALFGRLGLSRKKYIIYRHKNEHEALELVLDALKDNERGALITDCGTPAFEDPGQELVREITSRGYTVTAVPGPSSLMTGLSLCPFPISDFYFAGFIPRNGGERENALKRLVSMKETVIFLETPYRFRNTLELLKKHCPNRRIFVPCNLTMDNEHLFSGYPGDVWNDVVSSGLEKCEFLVFLESARIKSSVSRKRDR